VPAAGAALWQTRGSVGSGVGENSRPRRNETQRKKQVSVPMTEVKGIYLKLPAAGESNSFVRKVQFKVLENHEW